MILRDFQLTVERTPSLAIESVRQINSNLFPLYEAARLDLKQRRPRAPFAKIVMTFCDRNVHPEPHFINCLGVFQVGLPTPIESLQEESREFTPLLAKIIQGLSIIEAETKFFDPLILAQLERSAVTDPPCEHRMARLCRTARSGTKCDVYFVARPGSSAIEVRIVAKYWNRTARVKEIAGPLFLEDDFPAKSARINASSFDILDGNRGTLVSIDLVPDGKIIEPSRGAIPLRQSIH